MRDYLIRRILYMFLVLWLVSIISFLVIQLPPGDFLSTIISRLEQQGNVFSKAEIDALRVQYGLDLPIYQKYFRWISGFIDGNFGHSFEWDEPVSKLIGERLVLTFFIAFLIIIFTYFISIPIGIYSATHQYSIGDNLVTIFGFLGLATPNFLLALIILYFGLAWFGLDLDGLYSEEYLSKPWSVNKFLDMMSHLPLQIIVVSTSLSAGLIRVMRASLLDELQKQYVITARAKGLKEGKLLFKYPVRLALNPIVSEFAMVFPATISAATITAIILNLPTAGPLLLRSLMSQDTYLAATLLMFMTFLVVVGTSVADLLLVILDPRIKLEKETEPG